MLASAAQPLVHCAAALLLAEERQHDRLADLGGGVGLDLLDLREIRTVGRFFGVLLARADDQGEHRELTAIYVTRGLKPALAKQVAEELMAHDALGAHARDELGISETFAARPIQAALASAGSFAVGAAMPLLVTAIAPARGLIPLVAGTSLIFLAVLGGLAARAGGAGVIIGAIRVTFWGALAMALTAGVGWLFGAVA